MNYQTTTTYSAAELQAYFDNLDWEEASELAGTKRNMDQNRFYWGYIIRPLADYFQMPKQEVHEVMKHRFLVDFKPLSVRKGEAQMPFVRSTTTLNEAEFEAYCRYICNWAVHTL